MTDFVGVDPHRLRILADRLKTLADAIARNGGVIRGNFNKWGGTLNLGLLMQQAAQVGDDARMMACRADAALNLLAQPDTLLNYLNHPGSTTLGPPVSPGLLGVNEAHDTPLLRRLEINIPWDVKDINSVLEAKQEADTLQSVLRDPVGNRDAITQIAQSLADHQDDSAYMTAFMGSNGLADIVAVANALHAEDAGDGIVLNKQSQALLAQFGQAAQTMSQLAIQGKHPNYLSQLTDPPKKNLWSAAMLFKYGPSGDKWDPTVLAAMTQTVLEGHQAGTLQVPPLTGQNATLKQKQENQKEMAEFDPACCVLDRTAQNGYAARLVLGGPDGRHFAQELINDSWHTPGDFCEQDTGGRAALELPPTIIPGVDLSQHVAAFLRAATSAQFGNSNDAKLSAGSLVNVIQATAHLASGETLPENIRQEFVRIIDVHTADLSYSAAEGFADQPQLVNAVWLAQANKSDLNAFLRQAANSGRDAGWLKGCLDAKISAAVSQQIHDNGTWLENIGHLYGMVETAIGENNFDHEETVAAENAEHQMLMNILTTGLTAIPGPTEGVGAVITAASNPLLNIGSTVSEYKLPQGDPAAALQENDQSFIQDKQWVQVPVVQGLIDAGQLHPPTNATWFRNGHVVADADFGTWIEENKRLSCSGQSLDQWINDAVAAIGAEQ